MIQLIVTDLDNTLLDGNKEVSRYSLQVLRKCQRKGIVIAFATARPERATWRMRGSLQPDYIISNNGATINRKDEVLYNHIIRPDIVDSLLAELVKMDDVTCITVEAGNCLFSNFTGGSWDNENWNVVFSDFQKPLDRPVPKLSLESENIQAVRTLIAAYKDLHFYNNSGQNWSQVMHVNSTKMNAVQYISSFTGIPVQNIAAFGDDFNDIDMIQSCGIGIAVENANERVKQAADDICPGNKENGVAKWLNCHLL